MTMIRLPPIGFWSYARRDDELSQGKLSNLRSLLMAELQQQYGRDQIHIFQDASTIPHGAAWEREIRAALGKSVFFIPIVTPNFIQSDWCCREVSVFREREEELRDLHPELPDRSRIFPVHFIEIDDVEPADPSVLVTLNNLQWFDFRHFRHKSYDSEAVRQALSELAGSMHELLKIKIEDLGAARESAHREAEAAARARRAAEAAEGPRAIVAEAAPAATAETRSAAVKPAPFRPPAILIAAAAALLISLLVIWLWRPGDAPAGPAEGSPPGAPTEDHAWLYGRWGTTDDCSSIMTISGGPHSIHVDYSGRPSTQAIASATPELVVTDSGNSYRRSSPSGTSVEVVEAGIPYTLRRCS